MVMPALQDVVSVPRDAIARWRAAMALTGLGLGTSGVGLAWDFVVHEVLRQPPESIYAAPHLLIFAGVGVTGLGFLASLATVRLRARTAL